MTIGKRIKYLLEQNNKTQSDLAKHLGTKQSTVLGWTKLGRTPSGDVIVPISEFLSVSPNYLLTGNELLDCCLNTLGDETKGGAIMNINRKIEEELIKLKGLFLCFGVTADEWDFHYAIESQQKEAERYREAKNEKIQEWGVSRKQFHEWYRENFDILPSVDLLKKALAFLVENSHESEKYGRKFDDLATSINRYNRELRFHQQENQLRPKEKSDAEKLGTAIIKALVEADGLDLSEPLTDNNIASIIGTFIEAITPK